jgi:GNAT superfamily N-acetyltransferase
VARIDRLPWSDERIGAHAASSNIEIWPHYTAGGFAELERASDGSVEIVYFALLPDFIGRRAGRPFLDDILGRARDGGTTRVAAHLHARPSPGAHELPGRRISRRPRRGLHRRLETVTAR